MPRGHDLGLNFAGIKSSDDGRGESGRFEMDGHHLDANEIYLAPFTLCEAELFFMIKE